MDPGYWWGSTFSMFWIFPLLCFAFMIVMVVAMLRRSGGCMPMRHDSGGIVSDARESPRQILDRRLASGELTREQYEAIRRDIEAT